MARRIEVQEGNGGLTTEKIASIARSICDAAKGKQTVIAVSATEERIRRLTELVKKMRGEPPSMDELTKLLANSEERVASLLASAMTINGQTAFFLSGQGICIKIDRTGNYLEAEIIAAIKDLLDKGAVVVITRFQGLKLQLTIVAPNNPVTHYSAFYERGLETTYAILAAVLGLKRHTICDPGLDLGVEISIVSR